MLYLPDPPQCPGEDVRDVEAFVEDTGIDPDDECFDVEFPRWVESCEERRMELREGL